MGFQFPLDTVLRLRRSQERLERLKLEAIVSEQAQARTKLQQWTESSLELQRKFQLQLGSGVTGSELQMEMQREANAKSVCNSLRAHIEQLEQRRTAQVEVFQKARRSREVLENLRMRKFDIYRLERGRRDQQQLDDLFLMRRGNKDEN